jgi:hypothetical protein
MYRRVGDTMEMRWNYVQSTAGTAGNGIYLFHLPAGFAIDTAKLPVPGAFTRSAFVGVFARPYNNGGSNCIGSVYAYNSTSLFAHVICSSAGTSGVNEVGSTYAGLNGANIEMHLDARFPIAGW